MEQVEVTGTVASGRSASRMTVQGWLLVIFGALVVIVAVGAVLGGEILSRNSAASDRITEHLSPAQSEAFQLQAVMIDQETGARGYALTADPQFLAPYTEGQAAEAKSAARIRKLLPDEQDLLRDLDRVEAAGASWRRDYADPLIAGITPGDPRPVDRASANEGKKVFDQIRELFDEQNRNLAAARDQSLTELRRLRSERNWIFSIIVVAILITIGLTLLLVRRLVVRPLDLLRESSRRVAEGDFEHSIPENGPEDLRAVARDVESMRERITVALASSREKEQQLAAQTEFLDAQAVELRRSNEELEQFAYVASHDLQEPLRKVASFCQLLEKRYGDVLDERGQQYIDFAVDGAKRMQTLITDLLTFSRVGRIGEVQESVSLDTALDKALGNLATAVEESDASIERPAALPEVSGDPTLLTMLWQNLVGNAIKFKRADAAPAVTIECEQVRHRDDTDEPDWQISVTDNGIGIPAEFADKVFVIFQRLHSRESYTGTGIGLALCKKIVAHHGGSIWIDTTYAHGTRICFTLPTHAARTVDVHREAALEGNTV
jgi:signal transduction histidine kinase